MSYPSMYDGKHDLSGKGRFLVIDTETKDLIDGMKPNLTSEFHIIVAEDYYTDEVFIFFDPPEKRSPCVPLEMDGEQDGYLVDGLKFIQEAEAMASHNCSGFDLLAFEKTFGKKAKWNYFEARGKDRENSWEWPFRVMDTYVWSTLLNPDRRAPKEAYMLGRGNVGPHSIEAHGIRIGRYKPENEDWSVLTDHMIHRCVEDVGIGKDYLKWLWRTEYREHAARVQQTTGLDINAAYQMEFAVAYRMAKQAERGFRIDMRWGIDTWNELNSLIDETERQFRPHMPMRKTKTKVGHSHWVKVESEFREWVMQNGTDFMKKKMLVTQQGSLAYMWSKRHSHASDKATQWKLTTAKGDYTANLKRYYPEVAGNRNDTPEHKRLVDGPFTPIEWEDIPLGNRDSVKQVLYAAGWRGVNYNDAEQDVIDDTGAPPYLWSGKIDEDSIDAWKERAGESGIPTWAEGIARWYILCSRRNQLLNPKDVAYFQKNGVWPKQPGGKQGCRGIIPAARCTEYQLTAAEWFAQFNEWPTNPDECWHVPSVAIAIGTNTFRMRHKVVVNIPSRGLYPLRRLFIARKGKKILGCDGSGLELRMLAHFMNDPEYTKVILEGDIHSYNQEKAGLPTRDVTKTFILN